jgi:crotonobetainyl-CoA:carnitine CoA-transferase CaiB-like acyl-CoA transferase
VSAEAVTSPLDGLRVLDIGTLFPAPLCAAMLATSAPT